MTPDIPLPAQDARMVWGSDVAAEMLRRLGIEYVCVNPGSSFRGLHDSLINYLANESPAMLLALHEESVVSIAHGYAKAAGRPMAVVLHSNVGLMNGMMSIFNAWCDRVPIIMLGATGAVDTAVRRNWIDWLHTSRDQGALIRNFVKWDDQPTSPSAIVEAMLRAHMSACTAPCGPSYVALDRRLQEDALTGNVEFPDFDLFRTPAPSRAADETISEIAGLLVAARKPVLLVGRASRLPEDWEQRVRLAELLDARVITDLRMGASFPTDHPLHGAPPDLFLTPVNRQVLAEADVVLSLDWGDTADVMRQAAVDGKHRAKLIQVSIDHHVHNGWSGDHQRLVGADLRVAVDPDTLLRPLSDALERLGMQRTPYPVPSPAQRSGQRRSKGTPRLEDIGTALSAARGERKLCLARVPLNWPAGSYVFHEPLDYLGYDGGGGVGSGPGMTIGTALALKDTGRLAVGLMGDGEFLGSPTALWTASHYKIPVLIVVANNRSYYTDEVQQESVAKQRNRPVENKWIGQRIDDPPIDIPGIARDFGFSSEPTVADVADLGAAIERGLKAVEAGYCYLLDITIDSSEGSSLEWLNHH
ncbi:thiamine pyrophosphate-binding protein [Mesorhizobium sp. P5_C1]